MSGVNLLDPLPEGQNDPVNHSSNGQSGNTPPPATPLFSSEEAQKPVDLNELGFKIDIPQTNPTGATVSKSEDTVVDNIVKQATADSKADEEQILRDLEKLDSKLEMDLPIGPNAQKSAKFAKNLFIVASVVGMAIFGLFIFQKISNNGELDAPFQSDNLIAANNLKAQKVANQYLAAALINNKIAYYAAQTTYYVQVGNSVYSTYTEKQQSQVELKKLKVNLIEALESMKVEIEAANNEIASAPELESEVTLLITEELNKTATQAGVTNSATLSQELRARTELLSNALKLSRDRELPLKLQNQSFAEMEINDLLDVSSQVLSIAEAGYLSKVASVQIDRTVWTEVFTELETITKKFDPTFSVFSPNPNGIIVYNNYVFNADTDSITVSGQVTTSGEGTFSLIADSIDALEASPLLKDLTYRTYSKTQREGQGFLSSISLVFSLES